MIQIDGSILIQIVNFVFLIWVLNLVCYRPIRAVLRQREQTVGGYENQIKALDSETKAKDAAYEGGLKDARVNGIRKRDDLVAAAAAEEKQLIASINQKAQAEMAEIRVRIERDARKVSEALQQEIDIYVQAISQKILGRAV